MSAFGFNAFVSACLWSTVKPFIVVVPDVLTNLVFQFALVLSFVVVSLIESSILIHLTPSYLNNLFGKKSVLKK